MALRLLVITLASLRVSAMTMFTPSVLASPGASYVTGATLDIDGGYSA